MAQEQKKRISTKKMILPLLPLRGLVVFPYMIMHFDVGRIKSIKAIEAAMLTEQVVFLAAQKDVKTDEPDAGDIHSFGTVSRVKQLMKLQNGSIRVLVEGVARGKIVRIQDNGAYLEAEIRRYPNSKAEVTDELEAMLRSAKIEFEEYLELFPKIPQETALTVLQMNSPEEFADLIAANILVKVEDKLAILSEIDIKARMEKLLRIMNSEKQIIRLEQDISARVKEEIDRHQREYYLREQLKAIQDELGEKDGLMEEVEEYRGKINALAVSEDVRAKLLKDVDRLSKMHGGSADSAVMRAYLDSVLELPWGVYTKDRFSVKRAEAILNADHYGLEKVKERVVEYLAVKHLSKNFRGTILCLVGPPGVGKTSVAKSIAKALNRTYVRISLGGVRDEAEIRGHRKTYVGAMPGRIMSAVRQAGSMNPFVLLDEIDKLGHDYKGDPSSALLEVLDAEQNFAFRDHYIEVPFDLSNVMFVTTANSLDTIPRPLLDRMEVIEISSYTLQEKLEIALQYLIPKQRGRHGLTGKNFKISRDAAADIISYYTREAGVRNLERKIAEICRKAAKMMVDGTAKSVSVTPLSLESFLGKRRFLYEHIASQNQVGVATGLAWTSVGGDTLQIETNVMRGTGKVELTGHLGDVMKESAKAAISYIRANCGKLGIDCDFYKNQDIHIHVPEGATPKDGPSAGITMATSVISALSGTPVRRDVAMTGEITLRGRVLPIGGLKEKAIAAHRAGVKTVVIPAENRADIEEIPENVRRSVRFVCADRMQTVLETALCSKTPAADYPYIEHLEPEESGEARMKQ